MSLPSLEPFFVFDEHIDVRYILVEPEAIHTVVHVRPAPGRCPSCGHTATRRHSRYARKVHDLPMMERTVTLTVVLNKWHCDDSACPRRVFSDRLDWLAVSGRYTARLEALIRQIAFSNSCLTAERLCRKMHIPISHDAILARIRKEPVVSSGPSPFRRPR